MGTKRRFRNTVGFQIRRLRSRQGLTQERFAAKLQLAGLNTDRSTLAKIEARMRSVYDYELAVIAAVLKVSMADLFPSDRQFKKQLPLLLEGYL